MALAYDGTPVVIASRKARALIGYLALREGTAIARGSLVGLLWGERGESQARASLRQTLSELRAALAVADRPPVVPTRDAVTWVTGSAWIDARALERDAASKDDEALGRVIDLVGGELMEGLSIGEPSFEQWLAGERERFRLLLCACMLD